MTQLKAKVKSFPWDSKGVTMLEYGLIAALIAVVCATILGTLGTNLDTQFASVSATIGK